jgi:hypothetical protein
MALLVLSALAALIGTRIKLFINTSPLSVVV